MRRTGVAGLMAGMLLMVAQPLWAATFTECPNFKPIDTEPGIKAFAGCSVLITVKPDLSTGIAFNKQPDVEDALVGVRNLSGSFLTALRLTGEEIFSFDRDFGLPGGTPTGYEGPGVRFSDLVFYYSSPFVLSRTDGTVNFLGIAPGGSAYFGLEGADTEGLRVVSVAVPFPSTALLMGVGIVTTLSLMHRRSGRRAKTGRTLSA